MSDKGSGFAGDVGNWLRGVCMGAADIVPGVSGGTIALILGHYERLVTGISHLDTKCLGLLKQRQWRAAIEHCDFRFLAGIGCGMATGVVALASVMHYLIGHHRSLTYAAFCGLILVSSWLVAKTVRRWSMISIVWLVMGGVFAWQLCLQQPLAGQLTPMTAFLTATVAICAMILPGISGAFVLLLLGVYHPVTELIKGLPKGEFTAGGLLIVACFAFGCLVGLLAFSRILRWLLKNRHDPTLACLVGLMLGSLYKIWPWQTVTPETAELKLKEQQFIHHWPDMGSLPAVLVVVVLAGAATFALEYIGGMFAGGDENEATSV